MEAETRTKYRIFISYSHEDEKQENILREILEKNGLCPISDSKLESGHGFHDQIKKFIAHAYVFMPIISKLSNQKGWVNAEIGYAMALNIPILPILIENDALPEEMIEGLQAVKSTLKTMNGSQIEEEKKRLLSIITWEKINNMVCISPYELKRPKYECAYYHIERTMMLVEYALDVRTLFKDQPKVYRQSGGLSSFHIPDSSPDGEEFRLRYLGSNQRVDFLNVWLRGERIVFEEFARESGFKILINLDLDFENSGDYAPIIRESRLNTLLKFFRKILELPKKQKIEYEVIIDRDLDKHRNIIIVGDLFAAESLAGFHGQGLKQTMLTRHAPTIKNQIELFDVRFNELKEKQRNTSVEHAISEIEKRLKDIRTKMDKNQ